MRTSNVRAQLRLLTALGFFVGMLTCPVQALAVSSAELYTTSAYQYGRFEARVQFAFGDGVVSSFFLWKDGSEVSGTYWNELDFEKLRAACELETNALYGAPEESHNQVYDSPTDLCGEFHTYAYEWTPDYIAWLIDGVEIRRESGDVTAAYNDNATQGMQLHFNIWPGDASFGGNFDAAILPVHQYINWVQYSSYVDGAFQPEWREDFDAEGIPASWNTANWSSPKNLSTHAPANVAFINGYAVLSLTADDAVGPDGADPMDSLDSNSSGPSEATDSGIASEGTGGSDAGLPGAAENGVAGSDGELASRSGAGGSPAVPEASATTEAPVGGAGGVASPTVNSGGSARETGSAGETDSTTPAPPSEAGQSGAAGGSSNAEPIAGAPVGSGNGVPTQDNLNSPTSNMSSDGGCNCQLGATPRAGWVWVVQALMLGWIATRRWTAATSRASNKRNVT